jgi:uncharacterized protein
MGNPKFYLQKIGDKEYKFILVNPDGLILLTSKLYSDRYSCEQGIELIRQNTKSDKVFVKSRSPEGLFYYNFKLPNNELLAVSEMCAEKDELMDNIGEVKKFASEAEVAERQ